jgi:hypothetical protein
MFRRTFVVALLILASPAALGEETNVTVRAEGSGAGSDCGQDFFYTCSNRGRDNAVKEARKNAEDEAKFKCETDKKGRIVRRLLSTVKRCDVYPVQRGFEYACIAEARVTCAVQRDARSTERSGAPEREDRTEGSSGSTAGDYTGGGAY